MNTPTQETLQKEYDNADANGKNMLERIYGKEAFASDYTNLKTLEDCCKKQNIEPDDVKVSLHASLSKYQDALLATLESYIVRDAIANNAEVKLGQRRYFPYFYNKPGVGFVFYDTHYDDDDAGVGSRLEFPENEQAVYFGSQFTELNKRRLQY